MKTMATVAAGSFVDAFEEPHYLTGHTGGIYVGQCNQGKCGFTLREPDIARLHERMERHVIGAHPVVS